MLQKVVFWLREYDGLDWRANLEELEKDLQKHGISCMYGANHDGDFAGHQGLYNIEEVLSVDGEKEQILYVSDSSAVCKELMERGYYVLPYRHEYNRNEIFESGRYFYIAEQLDEMDYESLDMAYRRLAGLPWIILETKRCIIRETTVEDVDAFYQIYQEPDITLYMEDLYADRDEEIAYVKDYIKNVYYFYGYGMWTVVEKESGQVIGRAGISWREGFELPELGFVIGVPWQRKGYAYEVCCAILTYIKEELGFTCLQALIMKDNVKSKALCGKLGFTYKETVQIQGISYERFLCYKK